MKSSNFWLFSPFPTPQHLQVPSAGIESEPHLRPTPHLWQCRILNPLHQARMEQAMPQRQARSLTHCPRVGTPPQVIFFFFFLVFLGLHPEHMEVPRPGVKSELLLLPAYYTTATAMRDPSRNCNLHHSSRQRQILTPLSAARDETCILMDISRVCYC